MERKKIFFLLTASCFIWFYYYIDDDECTLEKFVIFVQLNLKQKKNTDTVLRQFNKFILNPVCVCVGRVFIIYIYRVNLESNNNNKVFNLYINRNE